LAVASALAAPTSLLADEPAKGSDDREALFKQLDANGDGVLKADEIPEAQTRTFRRLLRTADADGNGELSRDEFMKGTATESRPREPEGAGGGRPEPEAIFERFDTNKDGKLVPDEVPEERRANFVMLIERVDEDGDKALTIVEFRKGLAMMRGEGGDRPGRSTPSQAPAGRPELLFRTLDTDGDGAISRQELYAAGESLAKLDRDSDGRLSRAEAGLAPGDRDSASTGGSQGTPSRPGQEGRGDPKRAFAFLDKDGDGKITKDEAPERMKENFDRIDTDGDGVIEMAEFEKMMEVMRARAGQAGRGEPGTGRPGEGGGQRGREAAAARFKQLDTNGDGKISKDEAMGPLSDNFDKVDADGDGFVELSELEKIFSGNRPRENSK